MWSAVKILMLDSEMAARGAPHRSGSRAPHVPQHRLPLADHLPPISTSSVILRFALRAMGVQGMLAIGLNGDASLVHGVFIGGDRYEQPVGTGHVAIGPD